MASVVPFYGVKVVLSEVGVAGGEMATAEEASMGGEGGRMGCLEDEVAVPVNHCRFPAGWCSPE